MPATNQNPTIPEVDSRVDLKLQLPSGFPAPWTWVVSDFLKNCGKFLQSPLKWVRGELLLTSGNSEPVDPRREAVLANFEEAVRGFNHNQTVLSQLKCVEDQDRVKALRQTIVEEHNALNSKLTAMGEQNLQLLSTLTPSGASSENRAIQDIKVIRQMAANLLPQKELLKARRDKLRAEHSELEALLVKLELNEKLTQRESSFLRNEQTGRQASRDDISFDPYALDFEILPENRHPNQVFDEMMHKSIHHLIESEGYLKAQEAHLQSYLEAALKQRPSWWLRMLNLATTRDRFWQKQIEELRFTQFKLHRLRQALVESAFIRLNRDPALDTDANGIFRSHIKKNGNFQIVNLDSEQYVSFLRYLNQRLKVPPRPWWSYLIPFYTYFTKSPVLSRPYRDYLNFLKKELSEEGLLTDLLAISEVELSEKTGQPQHRLALGLQEFLLETGRSDATITISPEYRTALEGVLELDEKERAFIPEQRLNQLVTVLTQPEWKGYTRALLDFLEQCNAFKRTPDLIRSWLHQLFSSVGINWFHTARAKRHEAMMAAFARVKEHCCLDQASLGKAKKFVVEEGPAEHDELFRIGEETHAQKLFKEYNQAHPHTPLSYVQNPPPYQDALDKLLDSYLSADFVLDYQLFAQRKQRENQMNAGEVPVVSREVVQAGGSLTRPELEKFRSFFHLHQEEKTYWVAEFVKEKMSSVATRIDENRGNLEEKAQQEAYRASVYLELLENYFKFLAHYRPNYLQALQERERSLVGHHGRLLDLLFQGAPTDHAEQHATADAQGQYDSKIQIIRRYIRAVIKLLDSCPEIQERKVLVQRVFSVDQSDLPEDSIETYLTGLLLLDTLVTGERKSPLTHHEQVLLNVIIPRWRLGMEGESGSAVVFLIKRFYVGLHIKRFLHSTFITGNELTQGWGYSHLLSEHYPDFLAAQYKQNVLEATRYFTSLPWYSGEEVSFEFDLKSNCFPGRNFSTTQTEKHQEDEKRLKLTGQLNLSTLLFMSKILYLASGSAGYLKLLWETFQGYLTQYDGKSDEYIPVFLIAAPDHLLEAYFRKRMEYVILQLHSPARKGGLVQLTTLDEIFLKHPRVQGSRECQQIFTEIWLNSIEDRTVRPHDFTETAVVDVYANPLVRQRYRLKHLRAFLAAGVDVGAQAEWFPRLHESESGLEGYLTRIKQAPLGGLELFDELHWKQLTSILEDHLEKDYLGLGELAYTWGELPRDLRGKDAIERWSWTTQRIAELLPAGYLVRTEVFMNRLKRLFQIPALLLQNETPSLSEQDHMILKAWCNASLLYLKQAFEFNAEDWNQLPTNGSAVQHVLGLNPTDEQLKPLKLLLESYLKVIKDWWARVPEADSVLTGLFKRDLIFFFLFIPEKYVHLRDQLLVGQFEKVLLNADQYELPVYYETTERSALLVQADNPLESFINTLVHQPALRKTEEGWIQLTISPDQTKVFYGTLTTFLKHVGSGKKKWSKQAESLFFHFASDDLLFQMRMTAIQALVCSSARLTEVIRYLGEVNQSTRPGHNEVHLMLNVPVHRIAYTGEQQKNLDQELRRVMGLLKTDSAYRGSLTAEEKLQQFVEAWGSQAVVEEFWNQRFERFLAARNALELEWMLARYKLQNAQVEQLVLFQTVPGLVQFVRLLEEKYRQQLQFCPATELLAYVIELGVRDKASPDAFQTKAWEASQRKLQEIVYQIRFSRLRGLLLQEFSPIKEASLVTEEAVREWLIRVSEYRQALHKTAEPERIEESRVTELAQMLSLYYRADEVSFYAQRRCFKSGDSQERLTLVFLDEHFGITVASRKEELCRILEAFVSLCEKNPQQLILPGEELQLNQRAEFKYDRAAFHVILADALITSTLCEHTPELLRRWKIFMTGFQPQSSAMVWALEIMEWLKHDQLPRAQRRVEEAVKDARLAEEAKDFEVAHAQKTNLASTQGIIRLALLECIKVSQTAVEVDPVLQQRAQEVLDNSDIRIKHEALRTINQTLDEMITSGSTRFSRTLTVLQHQVQIALKYPAIDVLSWESFEESSKQALHSALATTQSGVETLNLDLKEALFLYDRAKQGSFVAEKDLMEMGKSIKEYAQCVRGEIAPTNYAWAAKTSKEFTVTLWKLSIYTRIAALFPFLDELGELDQLMEQVVPPNDIQVLETILREYFIHNLNRLQAYRKDVEEVEQIVNHVFGKVLNATLSPPLKKSLHALIKMGFDARKDLRWLIENSLRRIVQEYLEKTDHMPDLLKKTAAVSSSRKGVKGLFSSKKAGLFNVSEMRDPIMKWVETFRLLRFDRVAYALLISARQRIEDEQARFMSRVEKFAWRAFFQEKGYHNETRLLVESRENINQLFTHFTGTLITFLQPYQALLASFGSELPEYCQEWYRKELALFEAACLLLPRGLDNQRKKVLMEIIDSLLRGSTVPPGHCLRVSFEKLQEALCQNAPIDRSHPFFEDLQHVNSLDIPALPEIPGETLMALQTSEELSRSMLQPVVKRAEPELIEAAIIPEKPGRPAKTSLAVAINQQRNHYKAQREANRQKMAAAREATGSDYESDTEDPPMFAGFSAR